MAGIPRIQTRTACKQKLVRLNFCWACGMPRRRVHLDGVALHIVQRGHNREPCFFDEQDFHAYLQWFDEALTRERRALHAYVLMTNHVHLFGYARKR
jgi:REP element-mobilizing transposase RayT